MLNVSPTKHVLVINVKIHALEHVLKMLNVKSLIIHRHAHVIMGIPVTHSDTAISYHHNKLKYSLFIHVHHLLVGQIVNVEK